MHFQKIKKSLLLSILILIFASFISTQKNGLIQMDFTLKDGEYMNLSSYTVWYSNEDLIKNQDFPNLKTAIMRSFETEANKIEDFVLYANSIAKNRNLSYFSLEPWAVYGDNIENTRISDFIYAVGPGEKADEKADGFNRFYHQIFQNKTARTILFNQLTEILVTLCQRYPKDFKILILNELSQLSKFTNSLKNLPSTTNTDNLRNYWEGFIFRRNVIDHIPIAEIQVSLTTAINKISAINIENQPDSYYQVNINNTISIYYSRTSTVLFSKKTNKEIVFKSFHINGIKYLIDDNGEYYKLFGFSNGKTKTLLYDSNFTLIE